MQRVEQFKNVYADTFDNTKKQVLTYNWSDTKFYTAWVGQIYHFLCHSTRMIPFAASKFSTDDEAFFNRCIDHSHEERGHHLMAINDLKQLSSRPSDHPVLWPTEQLYSYPYHLIDNLDPIAIFGISAYMEGLAVEVGKEVTEIVIETFGKKAASFLISHTHDDEDHIKEVFQALGHCEPHRIDIIERSFLGANMNFLYLLSEVEKSQKVSQANTNLQATA